MFGDPYKKPEEIDILNRYGVCSVGMEQIGLLLPPREPMSKDQALVLAAWLVLMADPLGERFEVVLDRIKRT